MDIFNNLTLDNVKQYIENGGNPNIEGGVCGFNLIEEASFENNFEVVEYLLNNSTIWLDNLGGALVLCSQRNHIKIFKLLYKKIKEIDYLHSSFKTALYWSFQKSNYEIVDFLLMNKVNLFNNFSYGKSYFNYLMKDEIDNKLKQQILRYSLIKNKITNYKRRNIIF